MLDTGLRDDYNETGRNERCKARKEQGWHTHLHRNEAGDCLCPYQKHKPCRRQRHYAQDPGRGNLATVRSREDGRGGRTWTRGLRVPNIDRRGVLERQPLVKEARHRAYGWAL